MADAVVIGAAPNGLVAADIHAVGERLRLTGANAAQAALRAFRLRSQWAGAAAARLAIGR